jgi:hypothetical protein
MKATLEIDDDLLERAAQLARERGETTDKVVSDLLRKSIEEGASRVRNGFRLLPPRDLPEPYPDLALINSLRDDDLPYPLG